MASTLRRANEAPASLVAAAAVERQRRSRRLGRWFPTEPADEERVERDLARTEDRNHDENDEIGELVESNEVEDVVQVSPLCRQDRDDHAHGERKCRQSRHEAQDEQTAANEFAVADEHSVET